MDTSCREISRMSTVYALVEQAIHYLESHRGEQPSLKQIADNLHLSEYHFQRLFTRWVGISPKRFMQYLTKEHAKQLLDRSESLLDVSYRSGLSGPGRLHDLFVTWEAVTPGDFKHKGEGLRLNYSFHSSPFGEYLQASSERGITNLIFTQELGWNGALQYLRAEWPRAVLLDDPVPAAGALEQALDRWNLNSGEQLHLHLNGTNFQLKVWEALLRIPTGTVVNYEQLAISIGLPGAVRAVGNAIGNNPIAVIIPCHRVIRKSGDLGGYHWGLPRKQALLGWEAAQRDLVFQEAKPLATA